MRSVFVGLLLCATVMAVCAPVLAQGEQEADYSYGSVVEVRKEANELVVSEYDWDADAEVETVYVIKPDTKIENSASWKEIPEGSYVDIEYVTEPGGKKAAQFISVYEPEMTE